MEAYLFGQITDPCIKIITFASATDTPDDPLQAKAGDLVKSRASNRSQTKGIGDVRLETMFPHSRQEKNEGGEADAGDTEPEAPDYLFPASIPYSLQTSSLRTWFSRTCAASLPESRGR